MVANLLFGRHMANRNEGDVEQKCGIVGGDLDIDGMKPVGPINNRSTENSPSQINRQTNDEAAVGEVCNNKIYWH